MTAARSDLMAKIVSIRSSYGEKSAPLIPFDADELDLIVTALAASQPDRADAVLIERCAKIAEPWPGFVLDENSTEADRAVVAVRTEIASSIRSLAAAGTKSDGGQETDKAREARTALPDQRMPTPSSGTAREAPMNDRDRLAPSDTPIADSSAQKSAPQFPAAHNSGERDPSVMSDHGGADANSCLSAPVGEPLPYSTPMELFKAFQSGVKFVLTYHDRTYAVTRMQPREHIVYVQPPGLPVKVNPDGSSAEGPSNNIRLSFAPPAPAVGEPDGWLYTTEGPVGAINYFSRARCNEYMRNDPWTETALYRTRPAVGDRS